MVSSTQRYIDRRKSAPGFTPTQTSSAARKVAGTALSLSPQIYKLLKMYAKQQGISVGELIKTTYGDVKDSVLNIINADGTSSPVDIAKDAYEGLKDKITGNSADRAVDSAKAYADIPTTNQFGELGHTPNPSYADQMFTNSPGFEVDPSKLFSDTAIGRNPANLNNTTYDMSTSRYNPGFSAAAGNAAGGTGQLYSMGGGPGGAFAGTAPSQGFLGGLGAGINAAGPAAIIAQAAMTLYNAYKRPSASEAFKSQMAYNEATGSSGSPWGYTGEASSLNTFDAAGNPRTPQMPRYGGNTNNRTDGTQGWEDSMMGPSAVDLANLHAYKGSKTHTPESAKPFDVYNVDNEDYVKVGPNNPLYKRMGLTNPTGGGVGIGEYARHQLAYRNEMQDKAGENRGGDGGK